MAQREGRQRVEVAQRSRSTQLPFVRVAASGLKAALVACAGDDRLPRVLLGYLFVAAEQVGLAVAAGHDTHVRTAGAETWRAGGAAPGGQGRGLRGRGGR